MNLVMVNNPFGDSEMIEIKCGRARKISMKCFFPSAMTLKEQNGNYIWSRIGIISPFGSICTRALEKRGIIATFE